MVGFDSESFTLDIDEEHRARAKTSDLKKKKRLARRLIIPGRGCVVM